MSEPPLSGLAVLLAVAKHGTLRAAAAALGVQPPAISYRLKTFEDQIGVAVFTRTTRSVTLTDAGRALLSRVRPAMSELGDALEEARGMGRARTGTIRLTLPYIAYELTIAPKLAAFQARYPDIELELSFDEAFVDIVGEGFHAGVRMGDHIQEDMIAVRLSPPLKEVHFSAPTYFQTHARPRQPRDLLKHNCIRYRYIGSKRIAEWQFRDADGMTTVDVRGNLIVNSTNALIHAARQGLGIGWLFRANIDDDLRSGRLVSVLDKFAIERPGFFLYYPRANARLELMRIFIEFMRLPRRDAGRPLAAAPRKAR
ncbi:MAG TPA: LysR substrate-binding domain-containing protein [Stellaceae bacterium]|nr:LysR substrate-binding domain-containing protein [Stellaceae bacterium]